MAFQSAPASTANNANQNAAQPYAANAGLVVVTPSGFVWQSAPVPASVNAQLPHGFSN